MKQEWMTAIAIVLSIISGVAVSFAYYLFYIVLKEIIQVFPVNILEAYAPHGTLATTTNLLTTNTTVMAFYNTMGWVTKWPTTY